MLVSLDDSCTLGIVDRSIWSEYASRSSFLSMDVQLDRQSAPPDAREIEKRVRSEARDVYGWSNGPGDRYVQHSHSYHKLLYCTSGSIDFVLGDGRMLTLHAGDRMLLPAGTRHSAVVGPDGCACVEGKV